MNKKQLSEHIGNIDDRLVEQAEQITNYRQQYRQKVIRRFIGAVATIALMACSFSAGAFAFAHETIVEIPIQQEALTLEEIGVTLILPDNWKGRYAVEKNGRSYTVYSTQIREDTSKGKFDGNLFYIVCYEEAMTLEQFLENGYDVTAYHYLFSTNDSTYVFFEVSDVEWNIEDPNQESIYLPMKSEVMDIKFVIDNPFAD